MTALKIYDQRPNFAVERVEIGADLPYQLTHEEFHSAPVPAEQLKARNILYDIQGAIGAGDTGEVEVKCNLIHRFTPGVYVREFQMPAGSAIAGQRHAREHIVIVLNGHSTVFTEHGQEEIFGPCSFISPAGTKRILVNHTDTIWMTVHRTDACTVEEAEAELMINENKERDEALARAFERMAKADNLLEGA